MLKTNSWTYKNKDIRRSYRSESDSHIRGKVKIVLDLSNSATKKKLEHVTSINIFLIYLLRYILKI